MMPGCSRAPVISPSCKNSERLAGPSAWGGGAVHGHACSLQRTAARRELELVRRADPALGRGAGAVGVGGAGLFAPGPLVPPGGRAEGVRYRLRFAERKRPPHPQPL